MKIFFILLVVLAAGCGEPVFDESNAIKPKKNSPDQAATVDTKGEPDHVTVQHVLIGFEGSVRGKNITRSKAEAAILAKEVLDKAKAGEDFDALVKEHTDDAHPGIYQMANFGLEGDDSPRIVAEKIYPRSGMARAFGDVGFPLKVEEVGMAEYDPEKSKYGWHIIKRIK